MPMWMIGAVIERALRFVRESGAPRTAALWAFAALLVAAVLIRRRQDSFGLKLGASLLAFGGAAGALLWWSLQPTGEYYKFVDQVVAQQQELRFRGRRLVVHGCVVFESIERRVGSDEYRFRLASRPDRPRAVLEARYTGLVP